MRTIDADKLYDCLSDNFCGIELINLKDVLEMIDNASTVNAVVLPCKKGDTVWAKTSYFSKSLTETKVMFVWYNGLEYKIVCDGIGQLTFGKNVFLTKEAAENALKGGASK